MTGRGLRAALAVSVLANMFAFGAIGGGLWMLRQKDTPRLTPGPQPRPIRTAGQGLPTPDRQRFEDTISEVLLHNRELQNAADQGRRNAAGLFTQPQFDEAAVAAELERARQADTTLQALLDTAAIDFAAALPRDERGTLAEGLQHGGPLRHPP